MASQDTELSVPKIWMIGVGLFLCSLFLTAYSSKNPTLQGIGWRVLAEVISPFEKVIKVSFDGVKQFFNGYVWLVQVGEQNQTLQQRVSALESENSILRESARELDRIKVVVDGKQELNLQGVLADVIGYDPSNWRQTITLSRGESDGVFVGAPVVFGTAAVGQVINVSPSSSQVLLVTDHTSGVDALVQRNRTRGVVKGSGRSGLMLDFVGQQEDIRIGDLIITSGMDGVFPKGLLAGVVVNADPRAGMFQYIKVKPSVDFRFLENVLIVTTRVLPEELPKKSLSPVTPPGKRAARDTLEGSY